MPFLSRSVASALDTVLPRAGFSRGTETEAEMAVYTEVSDEDLERFVGDYDIGEVQSCNGIAEGVENSKYLLHTEKGH